MKSLLTSLAVAALISTAFAPQGYAAPAKMTAKQKTCKAQATAQVKREMGKSAKMSNPAAKAKGMGYYKQCMAT